MLRTIMAAALAAAAAGPAAAQTEEAGRDLRCLMVVAIYGAQQDTPEGKQAAASGFSYYVGRLKGREPDIDINARLRAEGRRTSQLSQLRGDFTRCADEMQAIRGESQALGETLKAVLKPR
jgi:hypothetical protein